MATVVVLEEATELFQQMLREQRCIHGVSEAVVVYVESEHPQETVFHGFREESYQTGWRSMNLRLFYKNPAEAGGTKVSA